MNQAVALPFWNDLIVKARQRASTVGSLLYQKDLLGMSASIAYYTVLSLTPFLLLFFGVLGFFGWKNSPEIREEVTRALGPVAAIVLNSLQARLEQDQGLVAFGVIGLITLIVSATGVISQLQASLNDILFDSQVSSEGIANIGLGFSAVRSWMRTKMFSVLALITCVFIATITLVSSVAIRLLLPEEAQTFWATISGLGSFVIFFGVFTAMFRFLPNLGRFPLSFCWKAGAVCSILFHFGKWAMESYFANSGIESSYGALSSFVLFLLWAYYNGLTILFSACLARGFFK